jgi:clathrin heavy chain
MIERSADAWEHNQFKDVIVRVANIEMYDYFSYYCYSAIDTLSRYYKALSFYVQEQPLLITDLLAVLTPRIDHTRVVRMFSRQQYDQIPLIRSYLISVQHVSNTYSRNYIY